MVFTAASLSPVLAILFGILIFVFPKLLNYLVATYLVLSGLIGLGCADLAHVNRAVDAERNLSDGRHIPRATLTSRRFRHGFGGPFAPPAEAPQRERQPGPYENGAARRDEAGDRLSRRP